ncbi:hypothetical protein CPB84DRAFT_1682718 [Gymnopilus junonius]|uniref:Uncharacterized protein n=1 Tax=Gymnopilus junonius TaxID=109634 RepID=A0A9P5NMT3_GYMJU|nr:hypothetical protein CPB84DRAFT_1682718 [Gymnopilus junonius]
MDFFWVQWLGKEYNYTPNCQKGLLPKIGFVESTDDYAFSFVNQAHVVCGCHLIPAFHEGCTTNLLPVPQSVARCLNPKEEDDWVNFYVNIFVDCDMIMCYVGSGVGHLNNGPQHDIGPINQNLDGEEPELEDEDGDPVNNSTNPEVHHIPMEEGFDEEEPGSIPSESEDESSVDGNDPDVESEDSYDDNY